MGYFFFHIHDFLVSIIKTNNKSKEYSNFQRITMSSRNKRQCLLKSPVLLCLVLAAPITSAFTLPTARSDRLISQHHESMIRSESKLFSYAIDNEDEAFRMMMKADLCAHSDTCSIDEAEEYLREMLHLQSNCSSGSLTSSKVCEDVRFPSEVIAGLREKIKKETELRNRSTFKVGFNPIFSSVIALYLSSGIFSLAHNNPDSFTMQEWMYAVQGGYLDEMVSQFLKYGGLSPITQVLDNSIIILPMSLQEWWWSLRDGYFLKMSSEYQYYGGLMTVVEEGCNPQDLVVTSPFTSEEWSLAFRDGYLSQLISHHVKNGGI